MSLAQMPERFRRYGSEPWSSRGCVSCQWIITVHSISLILIRKPSACPRYVRGPGRRHRACKIHNRITSKHNASYETAERPRRDRKEHGLVTYYRETPEETGRFVKDKAILDQIIRTCAERGSAWHKRRRRCFGCLISARSRILLTDAMVLIDLGYVQY